MGSVGTRQHFLLGECLHGGKFLEAHVNCVKETFKNSNMTPQINRSQWLYSHQLHHWLSFVAKNDDPSLPSIDTIPPTSLHLIFHKTT